MTLPVALALLALAPALLVFARRLAAPRLPEGAASGASVCALLPVRDEEENLAACVATLRAQDVPLRLRILNDGSSDRTAEIASRLAAADSRIEWIDVPAPPTGVNGKVHALAVGLKGVASEWVLAVDADARLASNAVARALAAARRHHLDAVSLAARQRTHGLGEALLTPLVFALLDALLGDWSRVARGAGRPVANGQFFLVRRDTLDDLGGYGAVMNEALDDVALAKRLRAAGRRLGFWRAREAVVVRMYRGFAASWRGWRRNLTLILGSRPGTIAPAGALLLLPAVASIWALATVGPGSAALAWAAGAAASCLVRAGSASPALIGLLYPLDALALTACLVTARRDHVRGRLETWRGRELAPGRAQPRSAAE